MLLCFQVPQWRGSGWTIHQWGLCLPSITFAKVAALAALRDLLKALRCCASGSVALEVEVVEWVGGSHVHASHFRKKIVCTRCQIATTSEVEASIFSSKIQWKQRLVVFVTFVKSFTSGSRWKQAVSAPKIATTRRRSQLHAEDRNYPRSRSVRF